MRQALWHFELLGRFRAESSFRTLDRFRTQKTAALLAYLALNPARFHAREALIERFWPDSPLEAAQTNLRVALNSLRKQLEPPGIDANTVLIATRDAVCLNGEAVRTDVDAFETCYRLGMRAESEAERAEALARAVALYQGRLLPALYEDWIVREQERLEGLHLNALRLLAAICRRAGDLGTALDYALRALAVDPLSEKDAAQVIRLYIDASQPSAALREYRQWEKVLREQLDAEPAAELRALVAPLLRTGAAAPPRPAEPQPRTPPAPPPVAAASGERSREVPTLPPLLTPMIGREEECEQVLSRLEASGALITLTGPGGVGKTRLAMEVAQTIQPRFPGAVAFLPLADFTDADRILVSILQAFQLRATKQIDPLAQLAEHLGPNPALLVLDNFEHLLAEGTAEIRMLRQQLPQVSLLITSRQSLGLEGEQILPVLPLPIPQIGLATAHGEQHAAADRAAVPESWLQNNCVRLFLDRAQAVRPDFQLTARNGGDVAKLCVLLEGMPLAIELAASWINMLTPRQMQERFQSPVRSLTGRRRDLSPRHQTLQNAIAWSHSLLPPEQQRLFHCLSVFHGGWTLEALEAVWLPVETEREASAAPPAAAALLDLLTELQERSLVYSTEETVGETVCMRYRMLESLREFASDALTEEERSRLQARHTAFFLERTERARQDYDTERQEQAVADLYADYENILHALEGCLRSDQEQEAWNGMAIAVNLVGIWFYRGMHREGIAYFLRALAHPQTQKPVRVRATALNMIATLKKELAQYEEAADYLAQGLAIRRTLGNAGPLGSSLNSLGNLAMMQGRWEEARAAYTEAAERFREAGKATGVAIVLRNLGIISLDQGDLPAAQEYCRRSLQICRQENYTHGIYSALDTLGTLYHLQGQLAEARDCYQQGLDYSRAQNDITRLPSLLGNMGRLLLDLGQTVEAKQTLDEALRLGHRLEDLPEIPILLEHVAATLTHSDPAIATKLYGASQALRDTLHLPKPLYDRESSDRLLATLRTLLGDSAFEAAFAAGQIPDAHAAVELALQSLAAR